MKAVGGLHIIGTERHGSRRIDSQLCSRAGYQGNLGLSRFHLSLDDQLLHTFAGDRVRTIVDHLKMPKDEPIEANIVTRSIESVQCKIKSHNFDIRKQLLRYNDVSNDQRRELHKLRNEILEARNVGDLVKNLRESIFTELSHTCVPAETMGGQWDVAGLEKALRED